MIRSILSKIQIQPPNFIIFHNYHKKKIIYYNIWSNMDSFTNKTMSSKIAYLNHLMMFKINAKWIRYKLDSQKLKIRYVCLVLFWNSSLGIWLSSNLKMYVKNILLCIYYNNKRSSHIKVLVLTQRIRKAYRIYQVQANQPHNQ